MVFLANNPKPAIPAIPAVAIPTLAPVLMPSFFGSVSGFGAPSSPSEALAVLKDLLAGSSLTDLQVDYLELSPTLKMTEEL
jgi:hypothetical protein